MSSAVSGGKNRAPTLYDVASLAGVSHQTVSRLVKGQTNIRPEIRARVEAAIEQLHYTPNLAARSLATSKSHRIGALFFDRLDEVGPTRLVQAASDWAREAGYLLDIVGLDPREVGQIDRAIEMVAQSDVAGIMVFAPTDDVLDKIEKRNFTVPVYIESDSVRPIDDMHPTDNAIGERKLVEYLGSLGHTEFIHVSGPLDWFAARGRRNEYEAVVRDNGWVSHGVLEGDWTPQSGYDAGMRVPVDAGITAIISSNDQMALGILMALRERGVRVPEDMSVVGFDDIPESRFFFPPLTTIRLDFDRQGRMAMEKLLQKMDPERPESSGEPLTIDVILRESSAPPPRRE